MRWGQRETSMALSIIGAAPLMLILFFYIGKDAFFLKFLVFISLFFFYLALGWINFQVTRNRVSPLMDKAAGDETVWLRFTKDRIFIPQFARKASYGRSKGVVFGEKADVLDDGDFAVKTLNGNPAIITYDMMNTSVDLKKSVARKQMSKIYNVRDGKEAYKRAKRDNKVITSGG